MNKLKFLIYFFLIVGLLLFLKFKGKNYYKIPTYNTATTINAVIEIPAGTNLKTEYNPSTNKFNTDPKNRKTRIINFLPYPANYGFIPSTLMDTIRGGDGDALDILVISEHVPMKTVLEVIPIGIIVLRDRGEIDNKILAVPADKDFQIISATSFKDLENDYPELLNIIQRWYLSYKGPGKIEFIDWKDEKAAMKEIQKWVN